MKKLYFIAAIAAIGMASCTSEEEVYNAPTQKEISIDAVSYKSERAAVSSSKLPSLTNIYVNAIEETATAGKWTPYFTNPSTEFAFNGGNWKGTTPQYYPTSGNIRFAAYCCDHNVPNPAVSGGFLTNDKRTPGAAWTYDANGNYQTLTLTFGGEQAMKGTTEVMVSNPITVENASKSTPTQYLTFNHTQAWVVVKISNGNDAPNDSYKFFDVKLDNVYTDGNLLYDFTKTTLAERCNWTLGASKEAFVMFPSFVNNTAGMTFDEAVSDEMRGILVLPQPQSSITITYKVKDGDSYSALQTHKIPLTGNWEVGKKYIYTVTVAPNQITFECLIDDSFSETKNQVPGPLSM